MLYYGFFFYKVQSHLCQIWQKISILSLHIEKDSSLKFYFGSKCIRKGIEVCWSPNSVKMGEQSFDFDFKIDLDLNLDFDPNSILNL
jgi:hypothetical protein